jgi:hypothetical protein
VDYGGYGLRYGEFPLHPPGADRRRHLQEGLGMKKTIAAFIAVATIAGSLAATPASAKNGVAPGVSATGYYPGPGPYDFGSCEWVTKRFWDGHGWRVRRVRTCF